jgi:hypothetical protein
MIEPKFPFRQFFDFRFGVNAIHLLQSPPPYPNAAPPARSALSVSQLAAPIERARFCRLASPADFVEWLASAQLDSAQALSPLRTKSFDGLLGGNIHLRLTERIVHNIIA